MKPEELYELIYSIAPDMEMTPEELEGLLCGADEIIEIGIDDPHALAYALAERGDLNDEELNRYLAIADEIVDEKK